MAITQSTALRDAQANQVTIRVGSGTTNPNGALAIRDGAVDAIVFQLAEPAFGAAASGVITLLGVPIAATAIAAVTAADNFEIRNRDGATEMSGTVTGPGGGGDIEVSNTNIALNQPGSLTAGTYTNAP